MFRLLTLFALCLFSLPAFAQTPATPPVATGQDAQPPVAARRGNKGQRGPRAKFVRKMDANADGKIARDEWKGQPESFDKLDADHDGLITQAEIRSVTRDRGAKMFQQFDANSDGKIARDEWNGNPEGFNKLDANQDGSLTQDEIRSVTRNRGAKMFQQFDTNSDGKIARDEWSRNPQAFDRLDANADGFLTPDEMRHHRGRRHKHQQQGQQGQQD